MTAGTDQDGAGHRAGGAAEFALNWRSLTAATIGMGFGSALGHYTMSLFAPALLREFGWSKAQFALIGSIPLATLVLVPIAGRFVDRFGTRAAAMAGFTALPLGFLAYTLMTGSIVQFFAIWAIQHVFGILTTSIVFCRIAVERFDRARGIALSIVMTAPPLAGAIAAPTLGALIDAQGWRAGYVALALITGVGGLVSILLMDRLAPSSAGAVRQERPQRASPELKRLLRSPTLLFMIAGMFLINVPQVFASSQLKLVAMDGGVSAAQATWLVSLYAVGVIIGRFASGIALDRLPAHLVALAVLGLPAIGYLIFAISKADYTVLAAAIMMIGFAQGAESDIGAYLLSRRFDMRNFSLLLSFLTAMIGLGSTVGSLVLSYSLHLSGSYSAFLLVSAVATVIGAILFGMSGSRWVTGRMPGATPAMMVMNQGAAGELG